MSAAQLAVVVAALQEDEVLPEDTKSVDLRKAQPRVNRDVLLALAQRTNGDVRDAQAD